MLILAVLFPQCSHCLYDGMDFQISLFCLSKRAFPHFLLASVITNENKIFVVLWIICGFFFLLGNFLNFFFIFLNSLHCDQVWKFSLLLIHSAKHLVEILNVGTHVFLKLGKIIYFYLVSHVPFHSCYLLFLDLLDKY